MDIMIPTSGRPRKQVTWNSLPQEIRRKVFLVVTQDEAEEYLHALPNANILVCPSMPIGPKRQWCVENAGHKLLMLDDDLTFFHRREDNPKLFRPATFVDVGELIAAIDDELEVCAHVGIGSREGGNRLTERRYFNTRLQRVLAYRTDVLQRENIRFDRLPVMEDFDVNLSLLRRGYRNVMLNWMVNDQGGSNAPGGCSRWRTLDIQAAAARKLAELHYGFVRTVEKTTKTAWGGQTRTDVNIQWKKAYESSKRPRSLD